MFKIFLLTAIGMSCIESSRAQASGFYTSSYVIYGITGEIIDDHRKIEAEKDAKKNVIQKAYEKCDGDIERTSDWNLRHGTKYQCSYCDQLVVAYASAHFICIH